MKNNMKLILIGLMMFLPNTIFAKDIVKLEKYKSDSIYNKSLKTNINKSKRLLANIKNLSSLPKDDDIYDVEGRIKGKFDGNYIDIYKSNDPESTKSVFAENKNSIDIYINGILVDPKENNAYILKENRVFVPIKLIAENLNYKVHWDSASKEVKLIKDKEEVIIKIGSKEYKRNSKVHKMNKVPFIYENKSYVPIRFFEKIEDQKIIWDGNNRIVLLGSFKRDNKNINDKKVYKFKSLNISMAFQKEIFNGIILKENNNRIEFWDIWNKTNENAGYIGTLSWEDTPITKIVPGIIIEYRNNKYLTMKYASNVQYNHKNKRSEREYDESKKIIQDSLITINNLN